MTELKDVLPKPVEADSQYRIARVISVNGHWITVDLNSGAAGTVIQAGDTCNPRPNDNVIIGMSGNMPVALQVLGGAYRQTVLTATSSTTTTVTGVLNGVSTAVTKAGAFTVSNGDQLPLMWSADGTPWVLGKAGAAYVPPDSGSGGGGSGGGSTPGSYTTSYAATSSGWTSSGSGGTGALALGSGRTGYFSYGTNRMNELQGKNILSAKLLLERMSGSGSVTVTVNKGGAHGSSTISPEGWMTFPLARAAEMINGTGPTSLTITGSATLRGIPSGTVQITWS